MGDFFVCFFAARGAGEVTVSGEDRLNEVQIYLTCKINHIRRQRQRQTLNICNFVTGILPIYLSAWSPVSYLGGRDPVFWILDPVFWVK